jgi:hypothetical protein
VRDEEDGELCVVRGQLSVVLCRLSVVRGPWSVVRGVGYPCIIDGRVPAGN